MLEVAPTRETKERAFGRDRSLLVVHDEEAARTLYVMLLRQVDGIGSVCAADRDEAVQLANELAFDLALLDVDVAGGDGAEAALELAALQPTLVIALHSAHPDPLRRRAAALGF